MSTIDSRNSSFLTALELLQARADRAQNQISTGFRVNQASDDPTAVGDILRLQSNLNQSAQVQTNLGRVKAEADAADTALSGGVSLLDQAIALGASSANGTNTADQRKIVAGQVQSLLEQMVSLSQTKSGDIYIFSGDDPSNPAYRLDLSSPSGVQRLSTAAATGTVQDVNGASISTGLTAQEIFDHRDPSDNPAADNAFVALNQLRQALLANDLTGIESSINALKQAHEWVGQKLAFYGTIQSRLAAAISFAQSFQVNQQAELSTVRDADVANAILDLTQARSNLQAAMQARAGQFNGSLFDFLK